MEQKAKRNYDIEKEILIIKSGIKKIFDKRNLYIKRRKKYSISTRVIFNIFSFSLKFYFLFNLMSSISFQAKLNNINNRTLQIYFSEIIIYININDEELGIISTASPCPDEIYLGNTKIAEASCYPSIENRGNLTFRLVWFDKLTTCYSMFNFLSNVIKIDLSKFDSSSVTDMSNMFYGCNSLEQLNLTNLDPSFV